MQTRYNRVAGQNVERIPALSDGIFAVAMTLLVLDLRVPVRDGVPSERGLWHLLVGLTPRLVIFLMSMMTLGIFWVGQQTQLNHFTRADRNLAWIHIAFLCTVCLVPFSTSLLGEYIHYRIALLVYWFNILLLGVTLYWSWSYATRALLIADDAPEDIHPAVVRRIVVAQFLYACGAVLCFLNTYYSITAIVLVQVNYAIAPQFCWGLFSRKSSRATHSKFCSLGQQAREGHGLKPVVWRRALVSRVFHADMQFETCLTWPSLSHDSDGGFDPTRFHQFACEGENLN